jgi:5S rRNA maturation endonuclease (ribonuclease M5)
MSFIDFVKEARRKAIIAGRSETGDKIPKGFNALYKKFLYFCNFYAPSSPIIVCEGKTDNVYIRLSAMALHKKLSILTKVEKKKVSFAVRLFNYSSTTLRLMGIGGGSGQLGNFIGQYNQNVSGFAAVGQKHPVIVLVDNDSGAKPIYSACAGILKKPVNGDEPFYYLGNNLYVVPTPKGSGGVDTMIESFLPPKWLKEKLNGKKLNLENTKLDTKTEYGKSLFSEHIIKKNKKKVIFAAFEPLLLNIEAAIEDYYKILAEK